MTAVLSFLGRERTAFRRPVPSRALGSPPVGPYGGPGPLRTLVGDFRADILHSELRGDFLEERTAPLGTLVMFYHSLLAANKIDSSETILTTPNLLSPFPLSWDSAL